MMIESQENLQLFYDNFLNILHSTIDKFIPKKNPNQKNHFKPPRQIRRLLKEKLSLYKKSKLNNSFNTIYKRKCKEYDRAVRIWNNKIENNICKNPSSKKFYSFINKKLNSRSSIPPLRDEKDNLTFTDNEKADLLNTYFQQVFTKDDNLATENISKSYNEMENFEITASDIIQAVKDSKDKTSRSPEDIPIYYIKRNLSSLILPLLFLFNYSLKYNIIPTQWKKAIITPIHKKGDRSKPSNYRPISLTSSFCRIFEIIIRKKIMDHLSQNNLLSIFQYGFVPCKSVTSQLLNSLHVWLKSFSTNKQTTIIYTDISKAFDSVSHSKLVSVLNHYGLNKTIVKWIENFLKNRTQQVVIGKNYSSPRIIYSGVPQGSVIGPLLFNVYINDITQSASSLNDGGGIRLFADDAKLFSTDIGSLQISIDKMSYWLARRQLKLAPNKCFVLNLGKTIDSTLNVSIEGSKVSSVSMIKDLGIYISQDLKWTNHVNHVFKTASLCSYQILKSVKSKNIWVLIKLFKTYVRPKIEYSTSVWSPNLRGDIKKIENVQKRFTKQACNRSNIPFTSYQDRLFKLNLKSLEYRRIYFDLLLIYKIINGISDLNFKDYFKFRKTSYVLRGNSRKIDTLLSFKTPQWTNSFFTRTVKYWNSLPDNIACSLTLPLFKRSLCQYDLSYLLTKPN